MMQIHDESACILRRAYIRGGECPAEQWIQLDMVFDMCFECLMDMDFECLMDMEDRSYVP